MKPARFEYQRPLTLQDALSLLATHREDAALLAGGQSLVPMLNLRVVQPAVVIDINQIPELERIDRRGDRLVIGARARHNDVQRSALVRQHAPLITAALAHVAHEAIRNRGTLGGSLALADPAAELPACMVCLDAEIVATSKTGERRVAAADFFQGVYTTALEADEIIVRVEIPVAPEGWTFAFEEVARRHGDFAIAAAACGARVENGKIAACRVVFAGVETFPRRVTDAEKALTGSCAGQAEDFMRAIAALEVALKPMEGGEYPAAYRRHLAGVLLQRALKRVVTNAG